MISFWKSTKEFLVMQGEPEDLDRIVEIHAYGFERGWSAAEIETLTRKPGTEMFVAREVGGGGRDLAGFCIVRKAAREAEILSIAVDPAFQRHGIGGQLMRESIRHLQAERVNELFLEVEEINQPARALYKKLGFLDVGVRPGYYSKDKGGSQSTVSSQNTAPDMKAPSTTALVLRLELG